MLYPVTVIKEVLIRYNFVGVNLIVGTENGLYLLDRSGHGKGKYSALTYKCQIHCASSDEVFSTLPFRHVEILNLGTKSVINLYFFGQSFSSFLDADFSRLTF